MIGQNAVENNKTSIKQDIKHALTCWGLECHQQYKHLDVVQEAAYQKGKDRAVAKFVSDLKNLPNVPKEVYEAIKNDPTGTAKAIYEGLKQVPRDIIDTGKTIANVNTVGDTPAEFEKLGEADMALALNTLSGLVSAGTVTVAKKGGKIVIDASKTIKLKADFDPSLNVQTNGFSLPPKTAPKVINIKADKAKKGTKEYEVLNNPPANSHVKLDNGTEFKTNISGRIEEIEFQPSLTKNPRDSRQTAVGKQGVKGDVGGHVQACSLGGTCDNFNLFPQNSNFNNSAYKKWENEIRGALKNGDTVGKVKVSFNRTNPSNLRPDSLEVEYSINGKVKNKFFRNEANDK